MKFTIWLTTGRKAVLEKPGDDEVRGLLEITPTNVGAQIQRARDAGYEPEEAVIRQVERMDEAEQILTGYATDPNEHSLDDYFLVALGHESGAAKIAHEADYVLERIWSLSSPHEFLSSAMDVVHFATFYASVSSIERASKFIGVDDPDALHQSVEAHFFGHRGPLNIPSECVWALNRAVNTEAEESDT